MSNSIIIITISILCGEVDSFKPASIMVLLAIALYVITTMQIRMANHFHDSAHLAFCIFDAELALIILITYTATAITTINRSKSTADT